MHKTLSLLKKIIHIQLSPKKAGETNMVLEWPHDENNMVSEFIEKNNLSFAEIICLLMALVPHIAPHFFSKIIAAHLPKGGDFPEFGGVRGKNHRGLLPTGETVLFVLAGHDFHKRAEIMKLFSEAHLFARRSVLRLEEVPPGEPIMSGRLLLDEEYVDWFTSGKISKPQLSTNFPAHLINTSLRWEDLVLSEKTKSEVREVETWLQYNDKMLDDWNMRGKIKPGYRALFYGPSGTGKTMTASLLGKYTQRDVYRIDLSVVVSKYIGETEKNLSNLFNKAQNKDWILFFDEADSLFGKRTNIRDAHDKYANQEVSYLLQRIEAHAGLVILASNMKSNIDDAFARRFNAFIEFEKPNAPQRLKLWQNYLPEKVVLETQIQLKQIARNYELTGANIVNVIHHVGLQSFRKSLKQIQLEDLLEGIKKEYLKEGRLFRSK